MDFEETFSGTLSALKEFENLISDDDLVTLEQLAVRRAELEVRYKVGGLDESGYRQEIEVLDSTYSSIKARVVRDAASYSADVGFQATMEGIVGGFNLVRDIATAIRG